MAKKRDVSFNFGANVKPKKPKKPRAKGGKGGGSGRGNAWASYIGGGVSNAPIPD